MANRIADHWIVTLGVLALGLLAGLPARAQYGPYAPPPPQYAPPQNGQTPGLPGYQNPQGTQGAPNESDAGVARLSFIRGDVGMQRGDSGEASAATLNTPLMAGDKISTGDGSRAEVQLDFADILRLESNAQANIVTLSHRAIQVELAQGLATYSVLKGSEADMEIDTPNVAVRPARDGRYRIWVSADGETDVVVREGEADVSTAQGDVRVSKGQLISIRGTGAGTQYKTIAAPGEDEWDNWNRDRDNIILSAGSRQRTNPYYTGTQDLDQNGVWSEVPDYGQVWYPSVGADWAPYRTGRWVWEPYWGWTWVSYEPWGWAPYHYGRWFLSGGRWGWWPGPVGFGYRPIWAPAYVSFFGFGGGGFGIGFGAGFGFGSVGWLPIGPGDYFHPWWGGYRDRFTAVGVGAFDARSGVAPLHGGNAFSNLHDLSANERLRAAVSTSLSGNFGRGSAAVGRGINEGDLRSARMMTGGVPLNPTRESMRASDRPVSASAFAGRGGAPQHFFSTRSAGSNAQYGGRSFAQSGAPASGWQRFTGAAPGNRPPLNMSKPIVNPNTASRPAPSYGGNPGYRGGSSGGGAPGYHPSAPSPRGGGGGGGSRGGGGGGSHGGGHH